MLIAQFTDLHIVRSGTRLHQRVDTAERLRMCIATLDSFHPAPDLLLLTGDLADSHAPEEYAHLRKILTPVAIPTFVMPGNHDRRAALREAFRDHTYLGPAGPINYRIDLDGIRILLLDSVVEGEYWGELGDETLAWFAARLGDSPRTPTLVAVHHPPLASGVPGLDAIGLRNTEAFGRIVEANSHIVAVISGHYHRAFTGQWRGTHVVVAPSTAQTTVLDFAPATAPSYKLEPPGFCLHRWNGGLLATHMIQAGEFAGPYPYDSPAILRGASHSSAR